MTYADSMMRTSALALVLCVASAACTSVPAPSAAIPDSQVENARNIIAPLRAMHAEEPQDPALIHLLAESLAITGEALEARRMLELLVEHPAWTFSVQPAKFPGVFDSRAGRTLLRRLEARVPASPAGPDVFSGGPRDAIPEGIEAHPDGSGWFLGTIHRRNILMAGRDGSVREFVPSAREGLGAVLGLEVDVARNSLWAAANQSTHAIPAEPAARATLWQFDLRDGRTIARYEVPGEGPHLLNDMRVAANGTLFVTDSEGGMVWRLDERAKHLSPVVPPRSIAYPNGLAVSDDAKRLIVADWRGLWRIDAATGEKQRVGTPPEMFVGGIDGIERDGHRLYAVQNVYGYPRVIEVTLDSDWRNVTAVAILASGDPRFSDPTTLALGKDQIWLLARTNLSRAERGGPFPDPATLHPPLILEIARPR